MPIRIAMVRRMRDQKGVKVDTWDEHDTLRFHTNLSRSGLRTRVSHLSQYSLRRILVFLEHLPVFLDKFRKLNP